MGPLFPKKGTCDLSLSASENQRLRVKNFSADKDQTSNFYLKPIGKATGHMGPQQTRECSSFPDCPFCSAPQCHTEGAHSKKGKDL